MTKTVQNAAYPGQDRSSNTSKTRRHVGCASIIIMQGDNIEDVGGVTQESANVELLMPRVGTEIFILPNPVWFLVDH